MMIEAAKYNYKKTGLDWMPEVPEHWEIRRLKNIGSVVLGKMLCNDDKGGYKIKPYLKSKNIGRENLILEDVEEMWFSQKEMETYQIKKNDLLVSEGGDIGKTCIWKNEIDECYIQNSVHKITCYDNSNPEFYLYWLRTLFYSGYFKSIVNQVSIAHLTREKIVTIPCIYPPKDEQDEIVQYIKAKEEKINLFIQKKQRFIELLKEQKDLIAFSAIHMDGLKNGCQERRIKSFSQILRGKFTYRPRNDERLYDGEYPFIQTGEVSQANKYINGYRQTLNDWGYSVSKEFPKGTLCLTIAANVGDVAILNFNACFPDSIVGIVPNDEVDLDFLYHALKSLKAKFLSEGTLTTQYNLNVERIGPIKIPIPNLETQKKIVTELETETATIDIAIAKAEREIELIREYKEAMIAEAVMGKRK